MPKNRIEDFLTVDEVAKALKFHPYTVRRLCREEKIPRYKFGGQWRFRKDEIEKWNKARNPVVKKYQ